MILSVFAGILLFILAMIYLYQPKVVTGLYAFLRSRIFTDSSILLHRKKLGAAFLSFSIIILYSTVFRYISNLDQAGEDVSLYQEFIFQRALSTFSAGEYGKTLHICNEIIKNNPKNTRALMLAGSAALVQNNSSLAFKYWKNALLLEPGNPTLKAALSNLSEKPAPRNLKAVPLKENKSIKSKK